MSTSRMWRILVAVMITVVGLIVQFVVPEDYNIPEEGKTYNTYFTNCSNKVISGLSSKYFDKIKLKEYSKEGAEIIVTNSTYTDELQHELDNGFKDYIIGYSPMIAIFPYKSINDSNFQKVETSKEHIYYMTNMSAVLNAFLRSEDGSINLKDNLGFSQNIKNIKLGIPDNGCLYRREVIDSLVYILSDGKQINEHNADEISSALKDLLSKSVNILNPADVISNNSEYIMIIPEYLIDINSRVSIYPIYWNNCYSIPLHIMFNESIGAENISGAVDVFKSDNDIFKNAVVRNEVIVGVDNGAAHVADKLKYIYGQDNLEELLGKDYWK